MILRPITAAWLSMGLPFLLFIQTPETTSAIQTDNPSTSPQSQSTYVRLLESGRVPEERMGTILDFIGKRGTPDDLDYIFQRARESDDFPRKARLQALEALAEAAVNRDTRPSGDLSALADLIQASEPTSDEAIRGAAIRLAGIWKLDASAEALGKLVADPQTSAPLRGTALDALAKLDAPEARQAIQALTQADHSWTIRAEAATALVGRDIQAALQPAVDVITEVESGQDLSPLLAAFLNRQGGADRLAEALGQAELSADAARMALRALYGLGRTDPALVNLLSQAAGLDAEVKPPTEAEMKAMIAEVTAKGDPARGEDVFRRDELSCLRCHAVSGAGGGVGPDLSAVGSISPLDYLIDSILLPDQAIKEEFQTLVVLTDDGQVFQGIVADRDNQRIILREATDELRTIPIASIEDSREGGSLMPKGLSNLMTHQDFLDLIRFLSELGKPGPYAIPTTPTIQRWQVLKGADPELSPSQLPDASSDSWVPHFAKVSGALPLNETIATAGGPVVFLQGEVDVTAAGPLDFELDDTQGVSAYLDGLPINAEEARFSRDLAQGRHTLMLRIDTENRESETLRVEVSRPSGASTQFQVVGGF